MSATQYTGCDPAAKLDFMGEPRVRGISRRGALGATLAVTMAGVPSAVAANPDAELIRACAAYTSALATYDREGGHLECEDDPLWHALEAARAPVMEAEPRTMAGVVALARVARTLATMTDGTEDYSDSFTGPLPGIVVDSLLRLHGEMV